MICDALGVTFTELRKQPAWWVNKYAYYLIGKNKAQEQQAKKTHSGTNRPSRDTTRRH